ncbi:MAG: hypothetical protein RL660_2278 [Bacteroidota bacterium]|jgi:hypothetical protein
MRPSLQDLHDEKKYRKLADFHIDDTMKFLMNPDGYGKEPTKEASKKKQVLAGLLFFCATAVLGFFVGKTALTESASGLHILIALVAFFVIIIPFHEAIHAIVFKSFKARDVGFGFSPKAGMVYAYAQDYPISMRELIVVAVMPFAIITPLLIVSIIVFPQYATAIGLLLIVHTIACIGDFALIKYGYQRRNRDIYTYDDLRNKKRSYFFEKR